MSELTDIVSTNKMDSIIAQLESAMVALRQEVKQKEVEIKTAQERILLFSEARQKLRLAKLALRGEE